MINIEFDKSRYHLLEEMQVWCRENIGAGGYIYRDHFKWTIETAFGNSTFKFKNEKDATLFALKWSI